jgi:arylformamidase
MTGGGVELIDISKLIGPGLAMPPGRPAPTGTPVCDIGPDSPSRVTQLQNWTTHLATHVDVPRHFLVDGATVDTLDVGRFQGPATVVRVAGRAVMPGDVPSLPPGHNVLFATGGDPDDPDRGGYLHPTAVDVLLTLRPNLVGIDAGGVDRPGDEDCPAHHGLLGAGVLLLEGLDLSDVVPGGYTLWALPLRIADGDGSPVRAVLVRD